MTLAIPKGVTTPEEHAAIDQLEKDFVRHGISFEPPLTHTFTNGLYSRKIEMPAGSFITSKIHMTQHQWVCVSGVAEVFIGGEWITVKAGDSGITEPGTRRVLKIIEDSVWITYHPNPDNFKTVEEIENSIIFSHKEHLEGIPRRSIE